MPLLHDKPKPHELNPDSILAAEFTYVSQTAFQANEDRARVSNYYIVSALGAIGAIIGSNVEGVDSRVLNLSFAVVFLVITIIGIITVLQLARLRSAWMDSARAMNQIKRFYLTHSEMDHLRQAFHWTDETMPSAFKPRSISFLLTISVIIVDSVTAAAASIYLALGINPGMVFGLLLGIALAVFLILSVAQFFLYKSWLS